jgi:orotidine-5'-phosphate decarboxylase
MSRNFMELVRARWGEKKFVCVGLDTDIRKIPKWFRRLNSDRGPVLWYNRCIIDATHDLVCAYKPNLAFYEALGSPGIVTLRKTCEYIREVAPDVPIIADAKRGDIGSTNEGYVQFLFEYLGADAVTLHPYLGREALTPFLEQEGKQVFVLCRTSNSSAGEFQDLTVAPPDVNHRPLYQHVADRVASSWSPRSAAGLGLVVGATYPDEIREVRRIAPGLPILIPGVGAQGGDVEAAVKAGVDEDGKGIIVNSSRGIIFASDGEDFPEAAAQKTTELTDEINQHRPVPA